MRVYIIKRLLLAIPALLIVSFLIFFLQYFMPGDIIDAVVAQAGADVELDREMIAHELGLDAPVLVQYGRWLGVVPQMDGNFSGIFQGDLGTSWWEGSSVTNLLEHKWPVTAELGLIGIIIAQLIALPVGIYSALRQDTGGDYIGRSFAIACISLPGFWLGTMIIVYPAVWWGHAPSVVLVSFTEDPMGNLEMFIIPGILLGMTMCGTSMRMTRTMMLEVMRQDYIRTAWAKGLRERVVILRHALKNALIPVVTIMGMQVQVMVGGTVIIEQIFCLPGMGRLVIDALNQRDYPVLSGAMVVFAVALVLINLVVDLIYAYLDPRVKYR